MNALCLLRSLELALFFAPPVHAGWRCAQDSRGAVALVIEMVRLAPPHSLSRYCIGCARPRVCVAGAGNDEPTFALGPTPLIGNLETTSVISSL
jgi:hypothetical protein